MQLLACILVALGAATAHGAATPPPELISLSKVIDNEGEAVKAVHDFDLFERKLIAWDEQLAIRHNTENAPFLADGDLARAARRKALITQAYETVLARYPRNAKAVNYYGEFLYDVMGDKPKAVSLWQLAAHLDPKLGGPANNLAILYCHEGQYRLGFQYLDRALKLEPDNPDFLYNAAQIYLVHFNHLLDRYKGKPKAVYKQAMKYSKKATTLAPDDFELAQDYATNFYAAQNFDVEVNWKEAAEAWQRARALTTDPEKRFYCWLNEGRTWFRAGNNAEAENALRQALELRPDSEAAKNLLAKVTGEDEGAPE